MQGYNPDFLLGAAVPLPLLNEAQKKLRAPLIGKPKNFELTYTHFSIVLNKQRRFAFYAATNIDGNSWDAQVKTRDDFAVEPRVLEQYQMGNALYDFDEASPVNDFDKGHLAKFQDPQWGDKATIRKAAADTMTFANCVPQHQALNRGAWKSLEDYVLKKFTSKTGANAQKVTVLAGPLLRKEDPFYIDAIEKKAVQLPCFFWKIIVYTNKKGVLSAVGFLMSQQGLLFKYNVAVSKKKEVRGLKAAKAESTDFFLDFKSGEPYQVRLDFLEQATGFSFGLQQLHQPYTKTEATEVIYKRVELPVNREAFKSMSFKDKPLNFSFSAIAL